MAASVAEFVVLFPEFSTREPAQLAAMLARVEPRIASTFGAVRDEVIYLEMADSLAAGLQGRSARKQKDTDGQTTYARKLAELVATHAIGRRLT